MHLDKDNLAQLQAIIGDQVGQLLEVYLDSVPETVENIEQAIKALDWPKLQHATHTLKGSAASIGAPTLAELSQQLCDAAKNQQACFIEPLYQKLGDEIAAVDKELQQFLTELK